MVRVDLSRARPHSVFISGRLVSVEPETIGPRSACSAECDSVFPAWLSSSVMSKFSTRHE
jgi:hypothetical protein